MHVEKEDAESFKIDLSRLEHDLDAFRMAGLTGAHLHVLRILLLALLVARDGRLDAFKAAKAILDAPEAATCKISDLSLHLHFKLILIEQ